MGGNLKYIATLLSPHRVHLVADHVTAGADTASCAAKDGDEELYMTLVKCCYHCKRVSFFYVSSMGPEKPQSANAQAHTGEIRGGDFAPDEMMHRWAMIDWHAACRCMDVLSRRHVALN